ncbi:TlpA family protein disulfide reductase [Rhizobium leguminosarum bv. viciae]|uniref:TlpA disulfide reductase family protein n=1 Tax=Rhizobium leguminosarum TaxID=384 RepID=UPI00103ED6F3|nr:TlpA disulfide reductase family protein [Rhizobium leguminosarum]TBZ68513.1 TlpA family protein disulfide reductase [Rhizobium leguminosarum bv. viciae]
MPDLKVGDLAPSINDLEWVRGESLEAFQRGKVYIIAFMTTTCPACAREMPRLRQLQKKYRDVGLDVIGVVLLERDSTAAETRADVHAWLNRTCPNLNFGIGVDVTGQKYRLWMEPSHSTEVPTSFIVDRDGNVAAIDATDLDYVVPKVLDGS